VGDTHIGGYTELKKLNDSGKLDKMIKVEAPKEKTKWIEDGIDPSSL
jgi:hypothetical protein